MPAELDLRPSRYDHPDALGLTEQAQQYYVELYGGPDTDPLTADHFTHPRGGFLIGYLDAVAVAMGGWLFTGDPSPLLGASRAAHIRRMFTAPSLRRRGLARRLLAELEADAARQGADAIVLATGRPQTQAVALYRASGYVDVPAFGHYADSDLIVCLGKRLPARPG